MRDVRCRPEDDTMEQKSDLDTSITSATAIDGSGSIYLCELWQLNTAGVCVCECGFVCGFFGPIDPI